MTTFTSYLSDAAQVFPYIFANDFLRYAIGAGAVFLLVNTLLSRLLSGRRIRQRDLPKGQVRRELLTSLRTVLVFSCVGLSIWTSVQFGWGQVYQDPAALGWLWFTVSVIALIVLHDAYFYWTHRIIHDPHLFRRFHRTHHKSYNPTPFTAYAFDTEEAVINAVYLLLMIFIMPLSFLAIFIFTAHMMLRNAIGHCGYELFPRRADGRPLFDWMTTVTHHDLHHAEAGWNYGLYFTFWDRWMGTEHPDYHERYARAVRRPLLPRRAKSYGAVSMWIISAMTLAGVAVFGSPAANAELATTRSPIDRISGDWASAGYGVVVRLAPCERVPDGLCGDLIWAWDPDDIRPGTLNTQMLSGFKFSQERWRGGRLKNPEDGKVYRGSIAQRTADILELEGCFAIFCQSQTWRRVDSLPHVTALRQSDSEAAILPNCISEQGSNHSKG